MKSSSPGSPIAAICMSAASTAARKTSFISKYRLGTNGTFSNPPAYLPPDPKVLGDSGVIFGGSSDGYVYAVRERAGEVQWKFATSDPVIDSPVVIENRVYATTELGGLFCLNAETGKQIWWAPEVLHFVAAGKHRVYAADKLGRLRILDARNGATLDSLPTSAMPIKISNGQTDRIYLATEGGMIQCLREVEQTNPVVYNLSRKPPPDDERPKTLPKPKSKSEQGASKVASAPKKTAPKKEVAKKDDAGDFGDADLPADKPAKAAPKPKRVPRKPLPRRPRARRMPRPGRRRRRRPLRRLVTATVRQAFQPDLVRFTLRSYRSTA